MNSNMYYGLCQGEIDCTKLETKLYCGSDTESVNASNVPILLCHEFTVTITYFIVKSENAMISNTSHMHVYA